MADLPAELHEEVERLCAEGDDLMDQGHYDNALARFRSAWERLPSPQTDWDAATWILCAIADVHFLRGDFAAMRQPLMTAMRHDGATDNPYLRLRLGQCHFELGDYGEAANWPSGAFLLEGQKIFADDDPKYLTFVKSQLSSPPGGWPEGW
jgi:hypothetical protein